MRDRAFLCPVCRMSEQWDILLDTRLDSLEIVMAVRTADTEWRGNLDQGSGHMRFGSGAFDGPYDFRSRIADGKETSPDCAYICVCSSPGVATE